MEIPKPPLPELTPAFQRATSSQRFGNYFIDAIIIYLGQLGIAILASYSDSGVGGFATSLGIYFAYYLIMEGTTGKTLGKYVTGTKVVTEDGQKIDFNHVVVRTLVRYVPFEAFSFFFGGSAGRPLGWHDKWSKTMVIEDKAESRN